MKETRNCVICCDGEFTAKLSSLRKTCSIACSRKYNLNERKKRYDEKKGTAKWKAKSKAAQKKYHDKNKDNPEWIAKQKTRRETPEYKEKQHQRYMKKKMEKLNNERS